MAQKVDNKNKVRKQLCLALLIAAWAGPAHAFSCTSPMWGGPETLAMPNLTHAEVMRDRSLSVSNWMARERGENDIIVVGRFSRNSTAPFLRQKQLLEFRKLMWPPQDEILPPYTVEYNYIAAYKPEGFQLVGTGLVPFSDKSLGIRVELVREYDELVTELPPTDVEVIGLLRSAYGSRGFEVTTCICPSYFEIEPDQRSELVECYRDGECQ